MLITRNDRKVSQSRHSQTAQAVCLIRGDLEALAEVDAVKFRHRYDRIFRRMLFVSLAESVLGRRLRAQDSRIKKRARSNRDC